MIVQFHRPSVGLGYQSYGFAPWSSEPTTAPPDGPPLDLAAEASGDNVVLTWTDLAPDNTDYSIERRDVTAGDPFAEIDTTGDGDAETYTDVGPFTAKHRYAYRVAVVGGTYDGEYSNQVAIFGGSSHVGRMRRNRYR